MKTLFPFQTEGASWLADGAAPNRLLGDSPGLGKTLQAIRAADLAWRESVLVVCPAVARPHWEREFLDAQTIPRTVGRYEGGGPDAGVPKTDVVVVSWNGAATPRVWRQLRQRRWDAIILDEAHALKNPESQRTIALYGEDTDGRGGLVENAARVWPLTGTPILNGPHELWAHYRCLFPTATKRILSYWEWEEEMCVLTAERKVVGVKPDAAARLRDRLTPFVLRRRKADVLKDMPPLLVTEVPLGISMTEERDIRGEVQKLNTTEATIATAIEQGIDPASGYSLATLAGLQRLLGEAKARPAVALIEEALESGMEKAVVFAKHRYVVSALAAAFATWGCVRLDGSTGPTARQSAIDRFQTDPSCRVFVGQIDACSTAITLTAASDVFVVEPAWVPATNAQAIQRCHRIGQTRPVVARFLFAEGTVDEHVSSVLARKAKTLEALGLEDS